MKLLLISVVFFSFALAQYIDARPYPEDSSSSSWFDGLFTYNSNGYDGGVDLEQGTTLAHHLLDLIQIIPGMEPVHKYGKQGVKMVEDLRENAVNMFQGNLLQNLNLGSNFPMIASGVETIKSVIESVLSVLEQVIESIKHLSSVGDNILSSLNMTRLHLGSVRDVVNYLPI